MIYSALVKRLDPLIEEEVTIEVEGITITGFSTVCPFKIEEGSRYPVLLGFTVLNELVIREIEGERKELESTGLGYQYYIRGNLEESIIDAGLVLIDEDEYFADYSSLAGKYVEILVDRISIEFVANSEVQS